MFSIGFLGAGVAAHNNYKNLKGFVENGVFKSSVSFATEIMHSYKSKISLHVHLALPMKCGATFFFKVKTYERAHQILQLFLNPFGFFLSILLFKFSVRKEIIEETSKFVFFFF